MAGHWSGHPLAVQPCRVFYRRPSKDLLGQNPRGPSRALPRRGSFQEVVLDGAGRVRWNRVENLVAESAKAAHSSSGEQLWLVAQWLLGDAGRRHAQAARRGGGAPAGLRRRGCARRPEQADMPDDTQSWNGAEELRDYYSDHRIWGSYQ